MRLLQLETGPGELIDLHPNVTVITGLDPAGKELLVDAVVGLAGGRASSQPGLLEAHGVLFDLAPEALALLDISAGDVDPIVTVDHLPSGQSGPVARSGAPAPDIHERWQEAVRADDAAQAALASAEAVLLARAAAASAQDHGPETTEELTARANGAAEQRRRLTDELATLAREVAEASAARARVEAAVPEVHERRQEAAIACAAVAARLDAARQGGDDGAREALDAAAAALAALEAEVEAARQAGGRADDNAAEEPPAERLARLDGEIEALERCLAAVGPSDVERVASRIEPVRASTSGAVAPVPDALALADELEGMDADLGATEALGGTPGARLAEGRARLDAARQAHLEAERAVRRPELDREAVDRLEEAHAALLDAIEKAGGRFAGARAQRRVETLRAAEGEILDEMHLTSYSDYMIGSSFFHVDLVREAALDAARAELAAAEDAWKLLADEAETDRARAQQLERRRTLLDQARALVGRPASPDALVAELRSLRVEVRPSAERLDDLRQALDDAGVAVGGEDLSPDELLLVADAWLSEAGEAVDRERSRRADLDRLREERARVAAALSSGPGGGPALGGSRLEEETAERLAAAHQTYADAEARHRAQMDAAKEVAALAAELGAAAALEQVAAEAVAEADARVADAVRRDEDATAAHERVEAALATAVVAEADLRQALEARSSPSRDELVAALARAEATHAAATAAVARTTEQRAALDAHREAAAAAPAAPSAPFEDAPATPSVRSLSEEVEWYLLARLAAQRSVSLAGSVPLLLDDALQGLEREEIEHVLGRLERMAEAVQVIVVSDDPMASLWAGLAGADRAAVVRPQAASTV